MFLTPLTILILLIQCLTALERESLIDLPFKTPRKPPNEIHAKLTDNISGDQFFMQEYILWIPDSIQSKTIIESKTTSAQVHYYGDYERLVVQETLCDLYTYKLGWSERLPGVNKPLLNFLLLLGPSIVYRIQGGSFIWYPVDDIDVRGITMHGATTTMSTLNITTYYLSHMRAEEGIAKPSRIVFKGQDPKDPFASSGVETLTLDIYLYENTNDELDTIVQIPPGIGCSFYLDGVEDLPPLETSQYQTILVETIDSPESSLTKSEYYVDVDQAMLRLKQTANGIKTDAIYDYNLGIIYIRAPSKCIIQRLELTSPGVDDRGYLSLQSLLWLDKNYAYLGHLDYKNRPGLNVKAWENTEFDASISAKAYGKVVTTVYFAEAFESDTFKNHVLIGAIRKAYKKGSDSKYILIESVTRDYYDFKSSTEDSGFDAQFQMNDCYPEFTQKLELSFLIDPTNAEHYQIAQSRPYEFKRNFKLKVVKNVDVSPPRVTNIDSRFTPKGINIIMTIVPEPYIVETSRVRHLLVEESFLSQITKMELRNKEACLEHIEHTSPSATAVFFCETPTWNCAYLDIVQKIPINPKGISCDVYDFPYNNFKRVGMQLPLDQIQKALTARLNLLDFYIDRYRFEVNNVIDVTKPPSEDQLPYTIYRYASKLNGDDGSMGVTKISGVTNFASCWRSCANENLCETFSFCNHANQIECLITDSVYREVQSNFTKDDKCNTYNKNHLYDYYEIGSKRFENLPAIEFSASLYDCASQCYKSEDCNSFQFCSGMCGFADRLSDKTLENFRGCNIFTPKTYLKYKTIKDQTVVDIFHTELDINVQQCADLCDKWSLSNDEFCASFNFCPKGRTPSACYLSKYTVRDGKTTKSDKTGCHNYELTTINQNSNKNKAQNDEIKSSMSLGSAFGIVIIFVACGLIIGFLAPYGYTASRQLFQSLPFISETTTMTTNDSPLGWSKQINE